MGATDAVEDDVNTFAREVVNLLHEILMLVINWDTTQVGNGRRASRGTGAIHLQPCNAPKLHQCRTHSTRSAVN
jgi:hypothetical protein